jgi:acyl transferase domain-containing protein
LAGGEIDWAGFYANEQRLPLPTYPFERQRYWIEPSSIHQQDEQLRYCLEEQKKLDKHMLPDLDIYLAPSKFALLLNISPLVKMTAQDFSFRRNDKERFLLSSK